MNKFINANNDVIFDDGKIQGGVSFSQNLNPAKNLQLGHASKAEIKFTILDLDLQEFEEIDIADDDFLWKQNGVDMGYFKFVSVERLNDSKIKVVGYDRMQLFEKPAKSWFNSFSVPNNVVLSDLIDKICDYVGVDYTIKNNVNLNHIIAKKKLEDDDVSARDILQWALEIGGSFAYFDSAGTLIVDFYRTTDIVVKNNNFSSHTVKNYDVEKINKVEIQGGLSGSSVTSGSGQNAYLLADNPLLKNVEDAVLQDIADNLIEKLQDFEYTPADFDFFPNNLFNPDTFYFSNGDTWQTTVGERLEVGYVLKNIKIGDVIKLVTRARTVNIPVMQYSWNNSGFTKSIKAVGDKERKKIKSVTKAVEAVSIKADEVNEKVEEQKQRLTLEVATLNGSIADSNAQIDLVADDLQAEIDLNATFRTSTSESVSSLTTLANKTQAQANLTAQYGALGQLTGGKLKEQQTALASVTAKANATESTMALTAQYNQYGTLTGGRLKSQENSIATLTLTANEHGTLIAAKADRIELNGYVTFTRLGQSTGTTIIDGGNIKAGTVTASKIDIDDADAFTMVGYRSTFSYATVRSSFYLGSSLHPATFVYNSKPVKWQSITVETTQGPKTYEFLVRDTGQ